MARKSRCSCCQRQSSQSPTAWASLHNSAPRPLLHRLGLRVWHRARCGSFVSARRSHKRPSARGKRGSVAAQSPPIRASGALARLASSGRFEFRNKARGPPARSRKSRGKPVAIETRLSPSRNRHNQTDFRTPRISSVPPGTAVAVETTKDDKLVQGAHSPGARRRAGVPFRLSMLSLAPMEEISREIDYPFWFHVMPLKDRGHMQSLLDRAAALGAPVLIVTVDSQVPAQVHNNLRNRLGQRPDARAVGHYLAQPGWLLSTIASGKKLGTGNFSGPEFSTAEGLANVLDPGAHGDISNGSGAAGPARFWSRAYWIRRMPLQPLRPGQMGFRSRTTAAHSSIMPDAVPWRRSIRTFSFNRALFDPPESDCAR
nr:alpha-hydroxy-acid oxidizing protein [Sphingobium sp.]